MYKKKEGIPTGNAFSCPLDRKEMIPFEEKELSIKLMPFPPSSYIYPFFSLSLSSSCNPKSDPQIIPNPPSQVAQG